jgi:hypothetical protein
MAAFSITDQTDGSACIGPAHNALVRVMAGDEPETVWDCTFDFDTILTRDLRPNNRQKQRLESLHSHV